MFRDLSPHIFHRECSDLNALTTMLHRTQAFIPAVVVSSHQVLIDLGEVYDDQMLAEG